MLTVGIGELRDFVIWISVNPPNYMKLWGTSGVPLPIKPSQYENE
jgi:hypothetical protein